MIKSPIEAAEGVGLGKGNAELYLTIEVIVQPTSGSS
jgi:hypothetical protein